MASMVAAVQERESAHNELQGAHIILIIVTPWSLVNPGSSNPFLTYDIILTQMK